MERIIKFFPAYDKRSDDPKKDYGIGGVELLFLLKGELGAVQFKLSTFWMLPHNQKDMDSRHGNDHLFCHPMPTDLGYHSYRPMYEGQECITDECEWLDGSPCYYDGSGLNADRIYNVLLREGSDGVWRELEEYYRHIFEENKNYYNGIDDEGEINEIRR